MKFKRGGCGGYKGSLLNLSKWESSCKGSWFSPIEERSLVDTGGLNERGIDGVDVCHDDRTTIIQFAFRFFYLPLLQTALLASHPLHSSVCFQVNIFWNGFNRNEILNRRNFYYYTNSPHPPLSLSANSFLTKGTVKNSMHNDKLSRSIFEAPKVKWVPKNHSFL